MCLFTYRTVNKSTKEARDGYLNQSERDTSDRGRIHKLLEILVEELKDKVKLVLRMDDIVQP